MNASDITVEYNENGDHAATAYRTIDGTDYHCTCCGLAACGEAFFEPGNPFDEYDDDDNETEEWLAYEELRQAALARVRSEWNYDGSNWSEPVDEPEEGQLVEEPEGPDAYAVVHTAFHGGGLVGYAKDEAHAEAWIRWKLQGNSCTCGCYCAVPAAEFDDLPTADETDELGYKKCTPYDPAQ